MDCSRCGSTRMRRDETQDSVTRLNGRIVGRYEVYICTDCGFVDDTYIPIPIRPHMELGI